MGWGGNPSANLGSNQEQRKGTEGEVDSRGSGSVDLQAPGLSEEKLRLQKCVGLPDGPDPMASGRPQCGGSAASALLPLPLAWYQFL